MSCQLDLELSGQVANRLDSLLMPPPGSQYFVMSFNDKAYGINIAANGIALTYAQYYHDATRPGFNPNTRGLVIRGPGEPLLDHRLREYPNPVPRRQVDNRGRPYLRSKLTCAEANGNRIITKHRWPVECANGGVKQYRILDGQLDSKWFDDSGWCWSDGISSNT